MMCRSVRHRAAAPTFTTTSTGFMLVGRATFSIFRFTAIAASWRLSAGSAKGARVTPDVRSGHVKAAFLSAAEVTRSGSTAPAFETLRAAELGELAHHLDRIAPGAERDPRQGATATIAPA